MGEPVRIKDLAYRMVEKSGFTVRNNENPNGDIEIITTGLRPGEKLYEELLIDAETLATPHPKIMRAKEKDLSHAEIRSLVLEITAAISNNDSTQVRTILNKWVEGYKQPSSH